ncbi:MAG: 23S rRNA (uracil(1939)-C(5))-methyltransferase RlmD [Clostridia bacterium]
MKEKDIIECEIISSGMNGEGVARVDGLVVFVPLALVGEKVKAQLVSVKKKFATAKVIKILQPAPCRVTPLCPVFFQCGGCEMQHIAYDQQLQIKRANVISCFAKECGFTPLVDEMIHGEKQFGYRNKAQVPLAKVGDKVVAGYYKPNSHILVPFGKIDSPTLGDCPLHNRAIHNIIDAFCAFAQEKNLSIYCESAHTGLLRHIVIRQVGDSFAVTIVINGKRLPFAEELTARLGKLGIQFSLNLSINDQQTNVILGEKLVNLYGGSSIASEIDNVKFSISPLSFFQVNDEIRDKIYARVAQVVAETDNSVVVEAYSGIGILSNILAKHTDKLYGLEIVPDAVADANELAKLNNNTDKITNICGDVAVTLPRLVKDLRAQNAFVKPILALDPPRKGCSPAVIESILAALPHKIIYISCNPATLARDVKALLQAYDIEQITPYDMFPQTASQETLVVLRAKNQG